MRMVVKNKCQLSHVDGISKRSRFIGFPKVGQKSFGPLKGGHLYSISVHKEDGLEGGLVYSSRTNLISFFFP